MGRRPGQSRQLMLDSAVALLRERGASGVSIDAVLAHSGTPRGSVYHHFPGGRNELILGAVQQAGDYISGLIDHAITGGAPGTALEEFGRFWKQSLRHSEFRAGCPIVALAVDHRDDLPEAAAVVNEIFVCWQRKIQELLLAEGVPADRVRRLAVLAIAAIEGAVILCRAQRSDEPLDDVIAGLAPLYRANAAQND
ncbi:TetR/AcrR family transcriptional regulator [Amycolatopsis nigrescens]|uniref:TetR/AcrR family transcriptional regulator n=1 Tax=Amycolatopsis nigrescens TaxID=381445 RepID=UPI00036D620E|nr:TetR/AcrR family transcriptional regulator [Amycolatopsis nigrescens]